MQHSSEGHQPHRLADLPEGTQLTVLAEFHRLKAANQLDRELAGNVLPVTLAFRIKPNMRIPKLLSVAQVSARLQCARSTIRKLVADGELRASRVSSRTIRISEVDLLAYLDRRANTVVPAGASAKTNGAAR